MKDFSQVIALLRRLAAADGDVSVEETRWMRLLLNELPAEDAHQEFDPTRLKEIMQDEGDVRELMRLLLLVSLSDGETSLAEWTMIQNTADFLGFPADELETLRSETVLAAEPYS